MLDPAAELLRRASQLRWISGICALHHHGLEEIAAERTVGSAEPLVKRQHIRM